MPLLTESMAPVVSSYVLALRASSRTREADDAAPRSKRMCASGERFYGGFEAGLQTDEEEEEEEKRSVSVTVAAESDLFVPGTPRKDEECVEAVLAPASGWESLELSVLERVCLSLSLSDLCQLAQVNKHYREMCSRDALWTWRATEKCIVKAVEQDSWRSNFKAAASGSLHAAPFERFGNLHFSGDVTIVDPFFLFFQGGSNHNKQMELRRIVREFGDNDLVLTYRGIRCAVLRTSCVIDDDDTAFEVFRNGQEVGANVTTSGVVAVVPNRLVLQLIEENGGLPEEVRGVTVPGVDGILRCSSDGDFVIRHSRAGETDCADIVCSTGGSWTEDSDSDDEEEELTDEEMAEAVAEVAKLTSPYTNLQNFHCNGEGLIHKFSNFEVSMLS